MRGGGCQFYFQVLDHHRNLRGYFQWDPFITIERP
ncbi:AidA/PixA family protein [Streptomyces sp. NPDC051740]